MYPKYKKGENISFGKDLPFMILFSIVRERERERGGKKPRIPSTISQGFVGRNPLSQELKLIVSTRAMLRDQKGEISPKIQKRRFGGNQRFRVRRCFEAS